MALLMPDINLRRKRKYLDVRAFLFSCLSDANQWWWRVC